MSFGFPIGNQKDKATRRWFCAADMKGPEFVGGVLMGVHFGSQVQQDISRLQSANQAFAAVL